MLPISEVHFAFCGIATVAATLGYACARRTVFSLASPNESSKADVEAGPEERSLKRKLCDSDEHDVDAAEQSRPMKRNRTPPTDQHESDEDEWEVIVAPPPYEQQAVSIQQPVDPVHDNGSCSREDPHSTGQDIAPGQEPTPPAYSESSSQPEEKGTEARRCSTPQPPQVNLSLNELETPPPRPITPPKPTVPAKAGSAQAFSAFCGSSSPFASYSSTSGVSPFALSGQVVKSTPAWRRSNESESDGFGRTNTADVLTPSPNDAILASTAKPSTSSQSECALGGPGATQSLVKSPTRLTGEEDEDVVAELKGVKLFVKRGRKEFTDGMYGHIKTLTQKSAPPKTGNGDLQTIETETNSRTRLLFRRDPLGQVSMNVGLHPTVRCHFDSEENILRVIMMERAATDEKGPKEDVVVYALKPGRAQKADFQSFAKTLCDHDGLKSRVATSDVAAS